MIDHRVKEQPVCNRRKLPDAPFDNIIEQVRQEVINRSDLFEEKTRGTKDEYNLYREHVQYVYKYVVMLSEDAPVDREVLELSALLHDIDTPEYAASGLPQFKLEYSLDLKQTLNSMHMQTAFGEAADFSGISDGALHIGKIMQKTAIDVSQQGTKAAAATIEELDSAAEPFTEHQVILDRPFLYMIVDTDTMLPVFTGILNDPAG